MLSTGPHWYRNMRFWDLSLEMIRKSGDEDLLAQFSNLVRPGNPVAKLSWQIEQLRKRERELLAEIEVLTRKMS